jgi:hypothetical protein
MIENGRIDMPSFASLTRPTIFPSLRINSMWFPIVSFRWPFGMARFFDCKFK